MGREVWPSKHPEISQHSAGCRQKSERRERTDNPQHLSDCWRELPLYYSKKPVMLSRAGFYLKTVSPGNIISCLEETSVKSPREELLRFLQHPLWGKSYSVIVCEKRHTYSYLYSLRLSPEFNFQYLRWMIIHNRQAGRKTAGLEQPLTRKPTHTIANKVSHTAPTATGLFL